MRIAVWNVGENVFLKECIGRLLLHDVEMLVVYNNYLSNSIKKYPSIKRETNCPQQMIINLKGNDFWVETHLSQKKITVLGIQILNSSKNPANEKIEQRILEYMKKNSTERVIIIGNLQIEPGNFQTVFHYKQFFQNIMFQGWIDTWRYLHPLTHEYLWFSNAKRGLNFNFLLLGPVLKKSLLNAYRCSISTDVKNANKALIVELEFF